MEVLRSRVDLRSEAYRETARRSSSSSPTWTSSSRWCARGGGEKYVERHRQRGKLMARERIELLLDRDSPFLEIAPLAAWGTEFGLGGGVDLRHRRGVAASSA